MVALLKLESQYYYVMQIKWHQNDMLVVGTDLQMLHTHTHTHLLSALNLKLPLVQERTLSQVSFCKSRGQFSTLYQRLSHSRRIKYPSCSSGKLGMNSPFVCDLP